MDSSINNGMCRCCAAENTFKDLHTTYQWMGDEEIYSTMLRDCFNVDLITSEEGNGGICEVCITQLRNAANFKKQVLHTEEQFRRHLQDKPFKTTIVNIVKQEYEKQDVSDDDSDRNMSDDFSPDFEIPIKQEPVEVEPKTKSKKRAASVKATATVTKAKKAKIEVGESSTRRNRSLTTKNRDVIQPDVSNLSKTNVFVSFKIPKPRITVLKVDPVEEISKPNISRLKKTSQNKESITTKCITDTSKMMMQLHTENITNILLNSNATPFKSYDSQAGCACNFCSEQLPTPEELKAHTTSQHKNEQSIETLMSSFTFRRYKLKIDVTGLKCDLCDSAIDKLKNLMRHLLDLHKLNMHFEIGNTLIPFDFSHKDLTCVECFSKFDHIKMLVEHMNIHYRNYFCSKCGKSFVTKKSLDEHMTRHKVGVYPCSTCGKLFNTIANRKVHERFAHLNRKSNKCHCNIEFNSSSGKAYHMRKEHGIKDIVQCMQCDKTYLNIKALRQHLKRKHRQATKSCVCEFCGTGFYGKNDLVQHMLTHTKLKEYKCDMCHKEYGRKKTLREHMRIHNNERRFKCEYCGRAFVQKCSWRGHMKSKHGEIINN